MDEKRLEQTLQNMNQFGVDEPGITRLAYTKEWLRATEDLIEQCEREGMQVRMDSCGNVIARREGKRPELPAVAFGSHLDSVHQGGRYDGTAGVAAALEAVRCLNERGIETFHPIEILCFACEESSRFGVSTLGSKAMAGKLDGRSAGMLKDAQEITLEKALLECSLDVHSIERAQRDSRELKAFFELHIEQGPVLETNRTSIGIVREIAAPTRLQVRIDGRADHSGTTPVSYRKDALAGAAEVILEVERYAKQEAEQGSVATVGVCDIQPGAMNVVPGSVELKIDIRGTSVKSKERVSEGLLQAFRHIEKRRGLKIRQDWLGEEQPVRLHQEVADELARTCERLGISSMFMSSGAGHDAMNMACLCPTGLIFIPSKDGISHHPDELTPMEQIRTGAILLAEEVLKWAGNASEEMAEHRWERIR